MTTVPSTELKPYTLGDQTAAEPHSPHHEQAYSSNNEKHHDVSASEKHDTRKRKKRKQKAVGEADGEEQDEEEAGFGDYLVSLQPLEALVSS